MKTLVTIVLTTISILSFAQTDIIEMRSRNASLKKYVRTTKFNNFDHVASNFGAAPTVLVKTAVVDSVKCISDSVAIMYTSNFCWDAPRTKSLTEDLRNSQQGQASEQRYVERGIGELWRPGADTVINHPLFSHKHSLDSVKQVIDNDYYFNLPSDSIEFIGYDNEAGEKQEFLEPAKLKNEKQNSFGWELIFMLATPILFLLGMSRVLFPKTTI